MNNLKLIVLDNIKELGEKVNSDLKLIREGRLVKKVGGKRYSSSIGLKAVTVK